jgi:DNA-binding NarL/FixJ family response regulator
MAVRVLLVDEHRNVRESLAQRLRRSDQIELVGAVGTLDEAASLLETTEPPKLVLLDIHSADGRWVEACRAFRHATGARVVALTSFLTADLWRHMREAGVDDYLLKHIDTQQLGREIVRLAEQPRAERSDLEGSDKR